MKYSITQKKILPYFIRLINMKIVVLGSPGVGKGTYTQDLVKELDLPHLSTGDLFREHIKNQTALGKQVQEFLAAGKLVPDENTIALVKERLALPDCQKGFIFDGFPRTIMQAEALSRMTAIDVVLNFLADSEVILQRLSGRIICRGCGRIYHRTNLRPKKEGVCDLCQGELYQRDDDTVAAIKKRLALYEQQTAPLIKYYKQKKLLREITVNEEYGKHKTMIMTRILHVVHALS